MSSSGGSGHLEPSAGALYLEAITKHKRVYQSRSGEAYCDTTAGQRWPVMSMAPNASPTSWKNWSTFR